MADDTRALLQISCAMRLDRRDGGTVFVSPDDHQIRRRRNKLTAWFAKSPYALVALAEHDPAVVDAPTAHLSWLGEDGPRGVSRSRHAVIEFERYKGYSDSARHRDNPRDNDLDSGIEQHPLPPGLEGITPPTYEASDRLRARIRVQRSLTNPKVYDFNDYLIYRQDTLPEGRMTEDNPFVDVGRLEEVRLYLAFMMAQRRSQLFGSSLSERIYNIWLPPALLKPEHVPSVGPKLGEFIALPFVTLVRTPQSQAWRHTFTLTVFIVPVNNNASLDAREITAGEIGSIMSSLDGPSSNPFQFDLPTYTIEQPAELLTYSAGLVLGKGKHTPPSFGTFRQWLEGLLFAVARTQSGRWPSRNERGLADETLRTIRMTSLWSTVTQTRDLVPRSNGDFDRCKGTWWPAKPADASDKGTSGDKVVRSGNDRLRSQQAGAELSDAEALSRVPQSQLDVFNSLRPRTTSIVWPEIEHRIDQLETGEGGSWMSWAPPHRPCIVTFYAPAAERFPRQSWIGLFAWLAHMIIGAVSSREIMTYLAKEAEAHTDAVTRANHHLQLVYELEEMYDLDVASVAYRRFYRRLRLLRGLEEQYQSVLERANLLSQYRDVAERITSTRKQRRVGWAAFLISLAIIFLNVINVTTRGPWKFAGRQPLEIVIVAAASLVLAALLMGGVPSLLGRLPSRVKEFWQRARAKTASRHSRRKKSTVRTGTGSVQANREPT